MEKMFSVLSSVEQSSLLYKPFPYKDEVGALQMMLYDANQGSLTEPNFLANLCSKVESLVLATTEHLTFQETEVCKLFYCSLAQNCFIQLCDM